MRRNVPFLILLFLFCGSLVLGYMTTANYISASRATHGLKIELASLSLDLGEQTKTTLTFTVLNPSTLDVTLNRFSFSLYVNGRFVGVYDYLKKTDFVPGKNTLTVVADIHPLYARDIYEEKKQDTLLWFINGRAVVALPYRDFYFLLDVREYFAGG